MTSDNLTFFFAFILPPLAVLGLAYIGVLLHERSLASSGRRSNGDSHDLASLAAAEQPAPRAAQPVHEAKSAHQAPPDDSPYDPYLVEALETVEADEPQERAVQASLAAYVETAARVATVERQRKAFEASHPNLKFRLVN